MKLLILNRIKHKPILLDNIFSLVSRRPYIFPYLIDSDPILKKHLKNTIEPMNKKNNLMKNVNNNICKYISFRLLFETNINTGEVDVISLKNNLINNNSQPSMINFFLKKLISTFKASKIPKNINIDKSIIYNYLPSGEILINFLKDYLENKKEIILFYLPLMNAKKEKDEISNLVWTKEEMYSDSCFLNKLSEKNNSKISLMCLLNDKEYYNNPMMITYEKINKIFFYLNYNNCINYKNLFQNIYKYIIGIKHRQNLEEIFFSNSFQDEREKIMYFNYFIEDYFSFIKKMEKLNLNLFSLKKIEFFDDRINENVQRIQLRYFLNKIFGKNAWCKLIIINYKELENIDKLNERNKNDFIIKLNSFEKEKTNHKILYINLENFSPFQKNIIYLFENYIKNNKNINTIVINNIGNINYNNESYKTIKDNNKIKLPYIEQIIYDNNIFHENKNDINNKNNEIKEINYFFSSLCDDEKLLSYEGYDNNKNLVYFNACKKITCNELERVFKENKNIISLKLVFENIVIKYERNKSHLSIINIGQNGKEYI